MKTRVRVACVCYLDNRIFVKVIVVVVFVLFIDLNKNTPYKQDTIQVSVAHSSAEDLVAAAGTPIPGQNAMHRCKYITIYCIYIYIYIYIYICLPIKK